MPASKGFAAAAPLCVAAACWVVAIRQTHGIDMGVATVLGPLAFFVAAWVSTTAAMMLPAAVPAAVRRVDGGGLGAMSVTWMVVVTVLVLAQKVLPPRGVVDVPAALAM